MEVTFLRPLLFLALAGIIPLAGMLLYLSYQAKRKARQAYGEERLVSLYSVMVSRRFEMWVAATWVAVITLLVVAAAGPVIPAAPDKVPSGSLRVVVVSDVSKSMAAEDFRSAMPAKDGVPAADVPGPYGTRLQAVKRVIEDQIMPAITGNMLGISTYCGNGFDQADLTDDFVSLRWVIDNWMEVGNAPGGGSDYAEGLSMALSIFDTAAESNVQKVIVLFSDGGFTGEPASLSLVSEEIKKRGIRVVIVGVGSDQPIPIPQYNSTGQLTGYMQDENKAAVTTDLEERNLESLRDETNGVYVRLDPNMKLPVEWATKLTGNKVQTNEMHMFRYPVGLALVLLLGLFLRGAVIRRLAAQA